MTQRKASVIQGSFRGGLPVVQARFGPPRAGTGQVLQAKRPGVEAFAVDLRPKAGGQSLPPEVQAKMESALGADFSDVRIHVGREAPSVGAIAFTWGTDIHFAPGQYNPHTPQGQRLLGHELTHVVQQRAGRVSNPFGSGVAVVQDHALEAEADRLGARAAMTSAPVLSRDAVQSKQLAQSTTVQRFVAQPSVGPRGGAQTITVTGSGSSRAVGSVQLSPRGHGVVEISDMHVDRAHRRQGAGRQLMDAAIQTARRGGFATARLEARPYDRGMTPQALTSMYQRMGFRPVGMSRRGSPIMERRTGGAVQPKRAVQYHTGNAITAKLVASGVSKVVQRAKSGFSSCAAKVVSDAGSVEGSYNGIHGEINALDSYLGGGGRLTDITSIEISSAPCKYCHCILTDLGVRDKVESPGGFGRCQGGSYGWFYEDSDIWAAISKATGIKEAGVYAASVSQRVKEL